MYTLREQITVAFTAGFVQLSIRVITLQNNLFNNFTHTYCAFNMSTTLKQVEMKLSAILGE